MLRVRVLLHAQKVVEQLSPLGGAVAARLSLVGVERGRELADHARGQQVPRLCLLPRLVRDEPSRHLVRPRSEEVRVHVEHRTVELAGRARLAPLLEKIAPVLFEEVARADDRHPLGRHARLAYRRHRLDVVGEQLRGRAAARRLVANLQPGHMVVLLVPIGKERDHLERLVAPPVLPAPVRLRSAADLLLRLSARVAVQVEKDLQPVPGGPLDGGVDELDRGADVRVSVRRSGHDPVAEGEPDRVEAAPRNLGQIALPKVPLPVVGESGDGAGAAVSA